MQKRQRGGRWQPRLEQLESRRLLSVYGDFNGDGFADLAIGVPEETLGAANQCGGVNVIYGTTGGLTSTNNQWIGQNGFGGLSEIGDSFGHSLTVGDFNGDGFSDLAIGAPYEDIGSVDGMGAVTIVYGSSSGLTTAGVKVFHQDSPRVRDVGEAGDYFGWALTVGDFNGDGRDDLAVGISGEDIGGITDAGAVQILYGAAMGLAPMGGIISQDTPGVIGTAEIFDNFGDSLTAGDFNGDGFADLAIGVPSESISVYEYTGAVNVLYGGPNGVTATNNQLFDQESAGIPDEPAANEQFGRALASGDFNGDGHADLAIGVPWENGDLIPNSGGVHVVFGSSTGLNAADSEFWTQNAAGFGSGSEQDDSFGFSLAAGNLVGSSHDDLAIGAPNEDVGSISNGGAVLVLAGSSTGMTTAGGLILTQEDAGGDSEAQDFFGGSVTIGNFNGIGLSELVIGAPLETIGAIQAAGAVYVYHVSGASQMWHQDSPGILESAEEADAFGGSLAAGDGAGTAPGGGKGTPRIEWLNSELAVERPLPQPTDSPTRRDLTDTPMMRIEPGSESGILSSASSTCLRTIVPHTVRDAAWFRFTLDISLDNLAHLPLVKM